MWLARVLLNPAIDSPKPAGQYWGVKIPSWLGFGRLMSLVGGLGATGCYFLGVSSGDEERPDDVPGSIKSATQLILGGRATLADDSTPVELCFSPDGACWNAAHHGVDECHRYDDIQVLVSGIELTQERAGGWERTSFGWGCFYPSFEIEDVGFDARSNRTDVTVRIHGEEVFFIIEDWLIKRTLAVPETIARGTEVFVGVEPPVAEQIQVGNETVGGGRPRHYFIYDEPELNDNLVSFGDVEPEAWVEGGFHFTIPIDFSLGVGSFEMFEASVEMTVTPCAFDACKVKVNRAATVEGITVQECETCPQLGDDCTEQACVHGLQCWGGVCIEPIPIGDPCPADLNCLDSTQGIRGNYDGTYEVSDPAVRCDWRTFTCEAAPIVGEVCGEVVPGEPESLWRCQLGTCDAPPGGIGICANGVP